MTERLPHRWCAWYPVRTELLERRCAHCGAVERITRDGLVDATIGEAVAQLRAVRAAARAAGVELP
jgi:hypothetical protein